MLTWPLKGQELGWHRVLGTQGDQIEVFDVPAVVGDHAEAAAAAEVGVEGDVGHLLLLCGRMEADQTQLLQQKQDGTWALGATKKPRSEQEGCVGLTWISRSCHLLLAMGQQAEHRFNSQATGLMALALKLPPSPAVFTAVAEPRAK